MDITVPELCVCEVEYKDTVHVMVEFIMFF